VAAHCELATAQEGEDTDDGRLRDGSVVYCVLSPW